MTHQRFKQGGSHLGNIPVVTGTGLVEDALQQTRLANPRRSAEMFDELLVNGQDFVNTQMLDHLLRQQASELFVVANGIFQVT